MIISIHRLVNAAQLEPSKSLYVVACVPHPEFSLRPGDTVRVVVDPKYQNWLLREFDSTLHDLCKDGNYVTLAPKES